MDSTVIAEHRVSPGFLIVRGIVSIAFGILVFRMPGMVLLTFAMIYGIYAFIDGVFTIGAGIRLRRNHRPWGLSIFEGLLGIGAGVVTLLWPKITIFVLSILVGVWALAIGIFEVSMAFKLSAERVGRGAKILMGLAGVASILLGAITLNFPLLGTAVLVTLVASYAIVFGILHLWLGFGLRRAKEPSIDEKQLWRAA